MAFSELSAGEPLGRRLTVRRVESVESNATVRHVDQLETDEFQEFYNLLEDGQPLPADETALEDGEIVVFTDYFRVEAI
ncbi:hypothetical protein [Halopiger xanaduensis]|uniref:Uncharacterized protein n=1 Tax=Halopiger xanaduensis (strain DSM 18323 / JCM 14033 / SH-6) TaxID=797210 RepID=F8DCZ9_HALXS|nr:hypothetical protein [Halopiger xanaduensis]AEH38470.1 hypothetical protein Halxa_3865 [Halopiger xanaduensis SH-6]